MDRRTFVKASAGLAASASIHQVRAQAPAGARIVYPFAAGGGGDTVCRLLAERLQTRLKRPFIVENRTGADGLIGMRAVKGARPDGATILVSTGPTMYLLPMVETTPSFDHAADFMPVSLLGRFDFAIITGSLTGAGTFAVLRDWLKANPGKANCGIPSHGTIPHFAAWQIEKLLGFPVTRVVYRGGVPTTADIVGGHLSMAFVALGDCINQHRAGRLRIVAVPSAARPAFLTDVPTLKESGIDLVADSWYGMWLPAGSPSALRDELAAATREVMGSAEVKERLAGIGITTSGAGPAEVQRELAENTALWQPIVKATGYKITL